MGVDAVIIGGGPAGLAAALAARRRGLGVAVIEKRRRLPIDKPCGEGLMPDGVAALEALGVELPSTRHPLAGIRYLDGSRAVAARFPGRHGLGIRRTALHRAMLDASDAAGIDLRLGATAPELRPRKGGFVLETEGGVLAPRFLVAADGLRSPLRAAAGLSGRTEPPARWRFGMRRHAGCAPWSDHVEVYWADGCEAYVTPVASDAVGIALLWQGRSQGWRHVLGRFPDLIARLGDAPWVSGVRGCGPLRQRVRDVVRGNLALVGDASGYVDAITGEGLSLAFHQAAALAEAMAADDLGRYRRAHRRLGRWPDRLTAAVLALERRPRLRRRALAALARDPAIFDRLLAVHTRHERPRAALVPSLRLLAGIARR